MRVSIKYEAPLLLSLRCSQKLTALLITLHVLAIAASISNALPGLIKATLCLTISLHFYWQLNRLKNQYYTLKYSEAFGWELSEGSDFIAIDILGSTVMTTFVVFLHYKKASGRKRVLIIFHDALEEEDYRCFIVKLKTTLTL